MAIVAAAGLGIGGFSASKIFYGRGYDKAAGKAEAVILQYKGDLNACTLKNAEYVHAVAEQERAKNEALAQQAKRDAESRSANQKAEAKMIEAANRSAAAAKIAREYFERAIDQCLSSPVPVDFAELLNAIAAGERIGDIPTLPSGGSGDRQQFQGSAAGLPDGSEAGKNP